MIFRKLPDPGKSSLSTTVPHYHDHCLYYHTGSHGFYYPSHFTGSGLITLLSGEARLQINDSTVHLNPDSFLIVNRGSLLEFELHSGKWELVILYFNKILSELITKNILYNERVLSGGNEYNDLSFKEYVHYSSVSLGMYMKLLVQLGNSCASFQAIKADAIARYILDNIISDNFNAIRLASGLKVTKKSTRVSLYKRVSVAKEWMDKHYSMPITINQMADVAMLDSFHFLRIFKQIFKITPRQYLIKVRMHHAKEFLKKQEFSVSEICYAVGFESLPSFSTLFKKQTGKTPTHYRLETLNS